MIARLVSWHLRQREPARYVLFASAVLVVLPFLRALPLVALISLMGWRVAPRRITAFETALPISGRDLVMARMLATLALVIVPIVTWSAMVLFRGNGDTPHALIVAVFALATLDVLGSFAVGRGSPSARSAASVLAAIAIAGGVAIWRLPHSVATALFALGSIASLAVLWTSDAAVPQLAPAGRLAAKSHRLGHRPRVTAAGTIATASTISHARLAWAVARSTFGWNPVLFWVLLLLEAAVGDPLIFACIAFVVLPGPIRSRTRWMMAMPLSNRARLLAIVVPSVLVTSLCIGIGTAARSAGIPRFESLTAGAPSTSSTGQWFPDRTAVRFDHWRRAPVGVPPAIVAPWGERVAADTASILGRVLYNPFTSREESSPHFVEWQFERATAEVYGMPLTLAQYDAGARPHRRWDARWWLTSAAALLTLGLAVVFLGTPRYERKAHLVRTVWLQMLPAFALLASQMYRVRGGAVVEPLLHGALRDLSLALPAVPILALPLVAVPVVIVYLLLVRRFAECDVGLVSKPVSSAGRTQVP